MLNLGNDSDNLADGGYLPQTTSVRSINRARIISLLRNRPGLTRSDLSRLSGLSKGTVSALVAELLDERFLYEGQEGENRQRNVGLWLNPNAGVAIGIELSRGECRAILTDAGTRPLRRVERALSSTRAEDTIEAIVSIATELQAGTDLPCLGMALGVPGSTDAADQKVVFSDSLAWSDVPLAQELSARLGYSVAVTSRPRAGVLGEHWYGAGVGIHDLIYVTVSSGIGAGILVRGQLLTGANGFAGGLGHTTVLVDGPECVCGNRGCLEAVASLPAIASAIEARVRAGEPSIVTGLLGERGRLEPRDVIAAACDGDALAQDEIRKASRYVGVAVANLINLFNPARVIVGGQLAEAGEIALSAVRETAQRRALPLNFAGVQIVRNALGADSVCIGACALVVERYIAEVEPALRRS